MVKLAHLRRSSTEADRPILHLHRLLMLHVRHHGVGPCGTARAARELCHVVYRVPTLGVTNRGTSSTCRLLLHIDTLQRLCIDINLTVTAFVDHIDEGQLGPQKYLSTFSTPVSLTDNAIYGLQTLIGDAVVVSHRRARMEDGLMQRLRIDISLLYGMADVLGYCPAVYCLARWSRYVMRPFHIRIVPYTNESHAGSMMYILDMFASGVINGERGLLIYIFTFVANGSATGTSHLRLIAATVAHLFVQHSLHIRSGRSSAMRGGRALAVHTAASGPSWSCSSNLAHCTRLFSSSHS